VANKTRDKEPFFDISVGIGVRRHWTANHIDVGRVKCTSSTTLFQSMLWLIKALVMTTKKPKVICFTMLQGIKSCFLDDAVFLGNTGVFSILSC